MVRFEIAAPRGSESLVFCRLRLMNGKRAKILTLGTEP